MATYPVPNNPKVCKVTLIHDFYTRQFLNTFYVYKASADWLPGELATVAGAALTWWTARYSLAIPAATLLRQIQVRAMNPAFPYAYDLNPATPPAGQRIGTPEAGNVSVTLSERTGFAGRRHRGRMYVPGINENDCTSSDTISSTLATALASAGLNLLTAFVSASAVPVIFHRPGLVPSTHDNGVDLLTSFVVETIIDSMRRRLPGRGR